MGRIVGIILVIAGVADFGLSYMGINLTPFLPPAISKFSPMILGGLGLLILNGQSSDSSDDEDTSDISKDDK
ncbi:hypothetical protein OAH30_05320 [Candidatus Pelagibacter sp.]|jgi:hypothetical protein|nr:hypothetical protein [Candidatus Pelagibacter sp.]|tara:strand:- start:7903 stop:8118 length:216 start_codon:yes stop_codon:yes gene_type:complete